MACTSHYPFTLTYHLSHSCPKTTGVLLHWWIDEAEVRKKFKLCDSSIHNMICLVLWWDEPKTLNMLAHWVISETITLCSGFIRFGRVLLTNGSKNSFTYICFKITSDMPCRNKEEGLLSASASPFKLNLVLNQCYLTSCYIIGVGSCSRQLELWSFTFCQMWVRII